DVRVVLATNEDLSRAVAEGRFRQDLYYRINVINVELPALRSRVIYISTLANSFLQQVREDSRREVTGFADDAMATMERYHWPGNVRELQNVVERAVLLGKGPIITVADRATEVRGSNGVVFTSAAGHKSLKDALEGPERQIIREVLESNGWNRDATRDQLGTNHTALHNNTNRHRLR